MNELRPNNEKPNVGTLECVPPNQDRFDKTKEVGSTHDLGKALSPVQPANPIFIKDKTGSSGPQPKSGSPVQTVDMRFSVGDAHMPQPESNKKSGPGMVPVRRPSNGGGDVSYMKKAR